MSESKYALDLEKIIKQAALDGALTEQAVAQFHALVKERNSLKTSLVESEKNLETSIKVRDALRHERDEARALRDAWATRETDLIDREEKCTRLELAAEYEAKRVADHKEMFATVFKGMHVRKQVVTPGHAGHVDQYGTVQNQDYATTHDVEDKE